MTDRQATRVKHETLGPDGRPFSITWDCSRCGGLVGFRDHFCRHCGAHLQDELVGRGGGWGWPASEHNASSVPEGS
jgi:hypothetical protein